VGYLLLSAVLSGFIVLASSRIVRDHCVETLSGNLYNTTVGMRPPFEELLLEDDGPALDSLVSELGLLTGLRITVVDSLGVVLADTDADPEQMESHRSRPEIVWALRGDFGSSMRYSTTVEEELLYVAVPLRSQDVSRPSGVLRLSMSLDLIDQVTGELTGRILQGALVFTFAAILVAILFSRQVARPVHDLARATRRMAGGDFGVRVASSSIHEMAELGRSFNEMVTRTSKLVGELSAEKTKLDAIMSSIHEGLLVIDGRGKASLWNRAFEEITGAAPRKGEQFWRFITEPDLADVIRSSLAGEIVRSREINLGDRIYQFRASAIPSSSELVITLHDVTEIAEVLRMKRDFVANVSHELRTPLTAIKGFAETLADAVDPESRNHVGIIQRNTDRLISLIADLQTLTELESRSLDELELQDVDLGAVARGTLTIFTQRLEDKGLSLEVDIPDGLPAMRGDPFRLEQVFINLIDNAISYTEKGSIEVSIGHDPDSGMLVLEVSDTGIGIQAEDRGRIFERFYVADKSRSRQQGGTGLGLSIVKHIVMLHGGEIRVDSRAGLGSVFRVTFPISDEQV
jgi:two-component system phosphate regulon sensor histidine kinase PhoR